MSAGRPFALKLVEGFARPASPIHRLELRIRQKDHGALNPGHIRTSGAEWLLVARILEGEIVFVSVDDCVVDNKRS